jgi:hypothetical protein
VSVLQGTRQKIGRTFGIRPAPPLCPQQEKWSRKMSEEIKSNLSVDLLNANLSGANVDEKQTILSLRFIDKSIPNTELRMVEFKWMLDEGLVNSHNQLIINMLLDSNF